MGRIGKQCNGAFSDTDTCIATLPTNCGSDSRFPAETSPQLVLDRVSVLPTLVESTDQQCAGVDKGRALDIVHDGTVERHLLMFVHCGTRAQL